MEYSAGLDNLRQMGRAANHPLDKQGGEGGDDFIIGGLGVTLPEIEYPAKAGVKFNG